MKQGDPRNGARYRALRASMRGQQPCCLCGLWIDDTLAYPDPWSRSVQHVISVWARPDLALDPDNCLPAHLRCNQNQGRRPALTVVTGDRTSRQW